MKRGVLADYFAGVSVKRLSAVDANPVRSNQHEIGTTREMRLQIIATVDLEGLEKLIRQLEAMKLLLQA